jgi:hypothetical protein
MEAKPNPQLLYTAKALEAHEKALRTILKNLDLGERNSY